MNKNLKLISVLTGAIFSITLTGCGGRGPTSAVPTSEQPTSIQPTTSQTGNEEKAMNAVMEGNVAAINNTTALIPGQTSELSGDEYDNITVISKQLKKVDGQNYTVEVNWTYTVENVVKSFEPLKGSESNKVFYFNYPTQGQADVEFSFTGTPTCNGVTGTAVTFNVKLCAETLVFPEYTLAEILATEQKPSATTEASSTYTGISFTHVTNPEKGYWESNNIKPGATFSYMYVTVKGKVMYLSPDGNWGLIADGATYLEIYAGSGTQLMDKYYPGLEVGNYVSIRGEMSHYKGNVQLSYISRVSKIEKGSIADPADYKTLTEAYEFVNNQFSGDMNALVSLTGTYNGNLKDSNGGDVSADNLQDARFTFEVKVGSKVVSIAYDYHVSKVEEGQPKVFDTYKAFLQGKSVGDPITVKGTMRFVFSGSNVFTNEGSFAITPYNATDLA